MFQNPALRIALVFRGTVVREELFTQTSDPVVTVGEHERALFSVPAPGLPESLDMFRRTADGYRVRVTDALAGVVTLGDDEIELDVVIERCGAQVDALVTASGRVNVHEFDIRPGDWGLLELGEVEICFQLLDRAEAVAGRGVRDRFDGAVLGAVTLSVVVHLAFLLTAFLLFESDPELDDMANLNRFARVQVDDVPEPPEEEPVDELAEDTSSAKARGDEGKFGPPDAELVESTVPKSDGEFVDEVDPRNVGVNEALSSEVLGAGPLKSIFGNNDGFDAKFDVAMAGDTNGDLELGRGQNGMGFRGDQRGGGGESFGRIHGIGKVDTGGGKNPGAKLGPKRERDVPAKVTPGAPKLGDFCDRGDIRRVVNAKQNAVKYCFEKQLQTKPELSGKVVAQWQVGLDGSVMSSSIASSSLGDSEVEACITRVISRMRFQKPDGGICVINYPFMFVGLDGD
jgi:hypothetical protein